MTAERGLVFISHADEAAGYAARAKVVFEGCGYRTWLWHHNRPARGDLDVALYDAIRKCDIFAHICTKGTRKSEGQRNERLFAKVLNKRPFWLFVFKPRFLVLFKQDFVPSDIDHRAAYNKVSPETFDEDCKRALELLEQQPGPAHEDDEGTLIEMTASAELLITATGSAVVVKKGQSTEPA